MKRMKFLRKLLPLWHAREKAFRKWYIELVQKFQYRDRVSYDNYVEILELPEEVRGYREVRYPKMEAAGQKAESLLKKSRHSELRTESTSIDASATP
jgi:indolepyruvate ferredoxin oxidoreductase